MSDSEVLIVVSKLKNYVKSASGMNTSAGVAPVLSDIIRRLTDAAIERARSDGRKTLKDRDFHTGE
jgi:histone H3/H4